MDIEIIHRKSPGAEAEQISINLQALQAVPSFEAFGRFLEKANPFAFGLRLHRWRGSLGSEQRAL